MSYWDVFDSKTWEKYAKPHKVDLYTMSFFLSEVFSKRKHAEAFFLDLFDNAKKGAYILFVDNVSVASHTWFDNMVEKYNDCRKGYIDTIYAEDEREFLLERSEQARDLGNYYVKFREDGHPRTKTCVNYRICCKQLRRREHDYLSKLQNRYTYILW